MTGETPTSVLVQFARQTSAQLEPADILQLLVDAAPTHARATAAAALRITESGRLRVVATRGCPEPLDRWEPEEDSIGSELAAELLAASGMAGGRAYELPLVSGGDLFGVLVLIGGPDYRIERDGLELTQGLADVAAASLDRNEKYARLARSYVELRASREALAQGEKLRALGQMAAGISHDLKNILNPLSLQLEVLKRRIARDPAAASEVVTAIAEVVHHGLDVVERLRAFSRQDEEPDSAEPVELDQVMATAIELCRPRLADAPRIRLVGEAGHPRPVIARTSELVTAVVNLLFNAVDALQGEPGDITVRTGTAGTGGWIEVEDDGPGMPPQLAARVFEPFFTTKAEGTGLGLAMVYAFAQRHRGTATLDTEPGRGTRVRMWFPGLDHG
ncbi:MAG TPA: HAMP domain-containing sensor histidine kinase [Kofleriaceae bacterium]|nr:HAMP domain-containing sensor histidine kinase [Kofleriaceae bacterium]